jgi:hypothetical protein
VHHPVQRLAFRILFFFALTSAAFAQTATYSKLEASFIIASLATDPFDYTQTSFTDTTATSQMTYFYRLIATNASGNSLFTTAVCAVTLLAPVDNWRQIHFNTTANAGIAADTADPDHDCLLNIIEYAFASDPNMPSAKPLSFASTGGHPVVSFKRPHPAPADINYLVEVSNDLSSGIWSSGPAYATQTATNNNDGIETVTLTDIAPLSSAPTHYLRVRIARE